MSLSEKTGIFSRRLKSYIIAAGLIWTAVVTGSLLWNISYERDAAVEAAKTQARSAYEKDIVYRLWNAGHGGVYVPVTETTRPNPYLAHLPERDIATPSGKPLTLMNPACMTRQAHELGRERYGLRGHITSLKPIRKENAPDPWEAKALQSFETGQSEASSLAILDGKEMMRLMRPLITEKGCLTCHENQGYREGDIRGGISVSVPIESFGVAADNRIRAFALFHLLFGLSGLAGIVFAGHRLMQSAQDRRQAADQLLQREEMFRLITTTAKDAIILMDEEGRITYWNPAAETMFGYTATEVMGKNLHQLLAPAYFETYAEGFRRFRETGTGKVIGSTLEIAALRKDGSEVPVEVSTSALSIRGTWHAIGIVRDISERRKAVNAENARVRAEALSRTKSDFMAHMSHELRTPMNSVIGFASILREGMAGACNEKQNEYLDHVLSSAYHLLSLINDILDIAKIESGKLDIEPEHLPLKDMLDESLALELEMAMKHNIRVSLELDPAADVTIEADVKKVRQVLFNLLGNAIKFNRDGGSVVMRARRVSCEILHTQASPLEEALASGSSRISCISDRNGDYVEISVADSGIGIQPVDMPKLFTEFTQLRTGPSREYPGTGLGLALSRKLVEMHGGRIWAESEFGKGSTFTFILPLRNSRPS
jgi:PAS domain S-box-containing protein